MHSIDEHGDRSILIVASDSQIRGLDRRTGHVRWEYVEQEIVLGFKVRRGGAIELAITHGRVYAALHDRVVCLDYLSGAKIGEVRLPSSVGRPTFVIDQDHLFLTTGETIECFTLDGQRVWGAPRSVDLDGAALGFPGNVRQGDGLGSK